MKSVGRTLSSTSTSTNGDVKEWEAASAFKHNDMSFAQLNTVTMRKNISNSAAGTKRHSVDLDTGAPRPKSMSVSADELPRVWSQNAQELNYDDMYDEMFGIGPSQHPVTRRHKSKYPHPASVGGVQLGRIIQQR